MRTLRVQKCKCINHMIDYSVKFRPLYATILINTDVREVNNTISAIVGTATYSRHLNPAVNIQDADQCVLTADSFKHSSLALLPVCHDYGFVKFVGAQCIDGFVGPRPHTVTSNLTAVLPLHSGIWEQP